MTHRTASIIGGIGRTLIGLGLIVLSFAVFQLWGTGFQEARAQDRLETEFAQRQAALGDPPATAAPTSAVPTTAPGTSDTESAVELTTTAAPLPVSVAPELAAELLPEPGQSLGLIELPTIDVKRQIIEGISRGNLREGPGHYPDTPLPGQAGNAAIAGHRTTYGQPFLDLDLLAPGDPIFVTTLQGTFRYEVIAQANPEGGPDRGYFVVDPTQVEVLNDQGDNRLTLTACEPKFSARLRIIVSAVLVSEPAPVLPTTTSTPVTSPEAIDELALDQDVENMVGLQEDALTASLGWNYEERTPSIVWALISAIIFAIGWVLGRLWRRWPAYVLTAPFFLLTLFVCFSHVDRFLPAL